MIHYDTKVYTVSLDKIIELYLEGLQLADEKTKIVSKIPYVDVAKNTLVVVVGTQTED